ncbi:hypothetical protein QR685DRAFT_606049 [Neurospora intermedia]|uniref:Uncharacterized protein n=1 Tax=Neurospora intermedia TaxID=5142 RepID=A0ABR3DDL4_NEUIN
MGPQQGNQAKQIAGRLDRSRFVDESVDGFDAGRRRRFGVGQRQKKMEGSKEDDGGGRGLNDGREARGVRKRYRQGQNRDSQEWIEGGRMGLEGAEGLATNGWMGPGVYTTDPKIPETRATGMSCVKKGSPVEDGPAETALGLWCFHFYWSLGRKLGEPLWNGRPRIVPSLWGDHSTAARTVALSPSNSYRLGRYLYARGRVWAGVLEEGWI